MDKNYTRAENLCLLERAKASTSFALFKTLFAEQEAFLYREGMGGRLGVQVWHMALSKVKQRGGERGKISNPLVEREGG